MAIHQLGKIDAAEGRKVEMRAALNEALGDAESGVCDALMVVMFKRDCNGDGEAYATRTLFGGGVSPLERIGLVATELHNMLNR